MPILKAGENMKNISRSDKIRQIIGNISTLPTLPIIASQVMELTSNPRTSVRQLSEVISKDQSLATQILKIVNSAYYGFPRQISTIEHALVILGFNEIRNIAFAISILKVFPESSTSRYFDREKFWQHSIGSSIAARMLARALRYRVSGKAFIAGLIHDIGKIVLDQYAHSLFVEVIKRVQLEDISIYEAEQKVLKISHAEIGGWLVKRWNLPVEIEEAIKFHHRPEKATINPQLTATVHLSDILTRMSSIGSGGDEKIPFVDPAAWKNLKPLRPDLDETYLEYFLSLFKEEMKKSKALFDIFSKRG